jgi:DNA-binding transcriptional MocR family regulator
LIFLTDTDYDKELKGNATKEFINLQVAKSIEKHIKAGVLKVGDKLPSLQIVCQEKSVITSTAQLAYLE